MVKRTVAEISTPAHQINATEGTKRGRGSATTWAQKMAILDWLELPPGDNFRLITGSASANLTTGIQAGAKLTKKYAYDSLAAFVNQRCACNWDSKVAMDRYRAYLKIFNDTKRSYNNVNGPKYLIGEDDLKRGITTLPQKLNHDCYGYARLDILFGERQNVTPSCIMMTGAPVIINNIDRASVILAEDGGLLPFGENEEEEVDVDGSNITSTSSSSSSLGLASKGSAASVASSLTNNDDDQQQQQQEEEEAPAAVVATTAVPPPPQNPASVIPPAVVPHPAAVVALPAAASSVVIPQQTPAKKGGKKGGAPPPAIPVALTEAAKESVAAVADGSAPKLSLQKKKKDFSTSYAEVKEKELQLEEKKFDWTKGGAVDVDKENKRVQLLEETKRRDEDRVAETYRTEITAKHATRSASIVALIQSGKSPAEIQEYLSMLDL